MTTENDFAESVRYRVAFGLAAELVSEHTRGRGWAAEAFPKIVAQVAERLACEPADETLRDAVRDAVEGRSPRW